MSDYKPITGELRKYATVSWDPWPDARDMLYQMCDRIDAIHAGLERENAELKAELDRVTGEQEEYAHARGDSITGELRDWYKDRIFMANGWQEINDIADRIDVEHELEVAEAHANGMYEGFAADKGPRDFIELPKDADGENICAGDNVEWMNGTKQGRVTGIGVGERDGWVWVLMEGNNVSIALTASDLHHCRPDTWERIIEDAVNVHGNGFNPLWTDERDSLVARCKKLAGDAE